MFALRKKSNEEDDKVDEKFLQADAQESEYVSGSEYYTGSEEEDGGS